MQAFAGGGLVVAALVLLVASASAQQEPFDALTHPPAGAEKLREGHGLSAKCPGDRGLAADPAVVLLEDFEQGDVDQFVQPGRWTSAANTAGMSFVADVPAASSGKRALEMVATKDKDTGGYLFSRFPKGYDTLYCRFYTKFHKDNSFWRGHFVSLGGELTDSPWPMGGSIPKDKRFTTDLDCWPVNYEVPWKNYMLFYTYWHGMKTRWGMVFRPPTPLEVERDRWYCFEFMLKANSAPDSYDGEQAAWVDGKPFLHYAGYNFRTTDALKLNRLWLQFYVHDSTTEHPVHRCSFDDVVVATQYIGPVAKEAGR
jgi:hypothetical protein